MAQYLAGVYGEVEKHRPRARTPVKVNLTEEKNLIVNLSKKMGNDWERGCQNLLDDPLG